MYNAVHTCLAETGAIRIVSKDNTFLKLSSKLLQHRAWYRKICLLCKMLKNKNPNYLFTKIRKETCYATRRSGQIFFFFFFFQSFRSGIEKYKNLNFRDPKVRKVSKYLFKFHTFINKWCPQVSQSEKCLSDLDSVTCAIINSDVISKTD